MVIHDRKSNIYYQRDFITDVRNCEILSCKSEADWLFKDNFEYVPFETNSQIKHHSDIDGNVWMDLHSSVFMNFTRITYQTVSECFTNDMQFCRMRNIVGNDYDVSLCLRNLSIVDDHQKTFARKLQHSNQIFPPLVRLVPNLPSHWALYSPKSFWDAWNSDKGLRRSTAYSCRWSIQRTKGRIAPNVPLKSDVLCRSGLTVYRCYLTDGRCRRCLLATS